MISAGYMAKIVERSPDWLAAPNVNDIYSVSACISNDFADYINYWQHNGYWLFDNPEIIRRIAKQNSIKLDNAQLFYYEIYEYQFDEIAREWKAFTPESSFVLDVKKPVSPSLEGFDVVSFSAGTSSECSPLSCNSLSEQIQTNTHCLLSTLEEAKKLLEIGAFLECEPGPYRIFSVYTLEWP